MSLLFNLLSRLGIAFHPRSKCLLISWLQSPSAVILKPPKRSLSLFPLFPHLFAMKWWDQMPWSSFSGCFVLSQLFHYYIPGLTPQVSLECNPEIPVATRLVHGILQSILERVAIPSPGNLPNPGIEPRSPALQADSLLTELWGKQIGRASCRERVLARV